jgi:PncC family amidohydrolase
MVEASMSVEETIGNLLLEQGLTLATAESCTGGLVAHRLTNISGSSAYFLGGFVTYSNEAKEKFVGVRHETLLAHGAVSEETAREMAQGARRQMGTDLAVSVTGIAGPLGGTADKPVGLVYLALAAPDDEICQRHVWAGDRLANKEQSAEAALQLVLAYLQRREHA